MYQKRLLICTFGGILSAIMCLIGKQIIYGFPEITWEVLSVTMANRLLLGLIIGISCWRINYLLHGAILGLIVSLSVSIGFLPSNLFSFFLYTSAGIIFGIIIEWIATIKFKSPMSKQYHEAWRCRTWRFTGLQFSRFEKVWFNNLYYHEQIYWKPLQLVNLTLIAFE